MTRQSLNRTLCEDLAKKQTILREYMLEAKSGGRRDMQRELHHQVGACQCVLFCFIGCVRV